MTSDLRLPGSQLLVAASLLVGLLAGNGWSQIRGPQLGYVFDESQGILRPILGVPGASRLGDSLSLGVSLTLAEISPKQDYALGGLGGASVRHHPPASAADVPNASSQKRKPP